MMLTVLDAQHSTDGEDPCSIVLTETQLEDLARRGKLQQLRAREDQASRAQENQRPSTEAASIGGLGPKPLKTHVLLHSHRIEEDSLLDEQGLSACDLPDRAIDRESTPREVRVRDSAVIYVFVAIVYWLLLDKSFSHS